MAAAIWSSSPREILDLLNRYLTRMSQAIEAEGGVVDKYIGDAIMALFGAPVRHSDSPQRAVRCSLAMIRQLAVLNSELAEENRPPLASGIGINTGVVVAGNMGSNNRLNYTVIGDGVNLASRLEGLTKFYGVDVIVSESTRKLCADSPFRELDLVTVKGKAKPVAIYQPLEEAFVQDEQVQKHLSRYGLALSLYRQREFARAAELFGQLAREQPGNRLYDLYLARIRAFRDNPPPGDWEGVAVFHEK